MTTLKFSPLVAVSLFALCACDSAPAEPRPRTTAQASKENEAKPKAAPAPANAASPQPNPGKGGSEDPLQGKFSLEDATEGLSGTGQLHATISTSQGDLSCKLYEERAPVTVANFVGLARGIRPFKDKGKWVKRPAYDGTTFHRIIKGFMIQGGDPDGTGRGEPGYVIPDEIWEGAKHDRRGLLCMANRGPNTNGMQFFITDAAAPHLDRGYTIFGECSPDSVVEKLASVETRGSKPIETQEIKSVEISRK